MATMSLSLTTAALMYSDFGTGNSGPITDGDKTNNDYVDCLHITRTKMNYMPIFWMMGF